MASAVIFSVLIMVILSLLRVNVMVSILISALVAGVMTGNSLTETVTLLVNGMSDGGNTALSYILLGAFAAAVSYTGITSILVKSLIRVIRGKRSIMLLTLAIVASFSQNLIPVHIAFIPILIPPLLILFDKMKIDRRGVAAALTFGLKAPYMVIPFGFGLIFQKTIKESMGESGLSISITDITLSMIIPVAGMVVGLLIAIFFTYRKDRNYETSGDTQDVDLESLSNVKFETKHFLTLIVIVATITIQALTKDLVIGALAGLILMFLFVVVPFREGENIMTEGIKMMGMIAFIMLVSNGFANILQETGSVKALVEQTSGILGDNKLIIAFILLLVGLVVTIGIGTSFGTIPILAALYVPIASEAGFSAMAIAALIGTAGALGDAGSPASDSTLGPTSGLNADGKHNHIWDTCVPTFTHYNIPLVIFGLIAAVVL
ncbi:TRAP transporter large permease subunit [Virgibacillus sp. MSP4-1]|uniref:Na+/H+ antiporter family protein n=1 Tax=Virgibacillus sp. MSP4-1 TaxID=2700081 RepID=UPI0005C4D12A|nr:Na+/H+ antiporter NhaC family protein [Virgibacillus sp. MSP4-1]QHS24241.1 TRAP transporter large permease subunit [Virgibacillus sp. MSP4-1]